MSVRICRAGSWEVVGCEQDCRDGGFGDPIDCRWQEDRQIWDCWCYTL